MPRPERGVGWAVLQCPLVGVSGAAWTAPFFVEIESGSVWLWYLMRFCRRIPCWRPVLFITGRAISSLAKEMTVKEFPIMRTAISMLIVVLVFNFAAVARCDDDTPPAAKKAAEDKKAADKPVKSEAIPRLKDPTIRTTDEIKAFFQRGIAHPTGKRSRKPPQNRIYTVRELVAKFGKPDERTIGNTTERWSFSCADGTVTVVFLNKGYGGATEGPGVENRLRLQILAAADMTPLRTGAK